MASERKMYCMGCGESVPTATSERDGNFETRCLYCGLILDVRQQEYRGDADTETPPAKVQKPKSEPTELIVIADDSEFLREFLKTMIIKQGLAKEVIACVDGQEFVAQITKLLAADKKIGLVILDVEMPKMDGITAARTLRAIEQRLTPDNNIPILFFSVHRCDESMKRKLSIAHPASYINKGADNEPDALTRRVDQLVKHLLTKKKI